MIPHTETPTSRRDFLLKAGGGFGAVALAGMLAEEASAKSSRSPMAAKTPHFPATAKSVIFLFMDGGPSHLDLFDPKPLLRKLAGQQLPERFGKVVLAMGEQGAPLMADQRVWRRRGQSGLWMSDWLPHTAECADDLAVIRSCWGDSLNHSSGVCQMNTCAITGGRPSLGSWVTYGLGTENQDLPAYVVMKDTGGTVPNGPRNWSAGFMPASYQGILLKRGSEPIPNLANPKGVSRARQQGKLSFINHLNRNFAERHAQQSELEARIASYELAFRMQAAAPEVVDLSRETAETHALYGINKKETASFGRNCLLARRLVERGVRFVQLYQGTGSKWDSHSNLEQQHSARCREMDQPVAALLKDLKRRGLLDETLVVWGGEFGRTPMSEKGDGRDHNPTGFTMWMAGGGVHGGQTIGTTDELGLRAVEKPAHVKDIHTSILHLLGLGNMQLTYLHKGRPERPTINEGAFIEDLVQG